MAKMNDKQEKISYLKNLEDIINAKILEKCQKEVKNMRMHIDFLVKKCNKTEKKEEVKEQVVNSESKQSNFIDKKPVKNIEKTFPNRKNDISSNKTFSSFEKNNKFNRDDKDFKDKKRFDNSTKFKKFQQNQDRNSINEFRRSAEAVAVNVDVNNKNKFTNKNFDKNKLSKEDYDDINRYKKGNKKFNYDDDSDIMDDKPKYKKNKQKQELNVNQESSIKKAIITTEKITVKEFSEKIGKTVSEIVKKLMMLGIMSNINSYIDFDTAQLIADEFHIELEQKLEKTAEDIMIDARKMEDKEENLKPRPPIITVMGHVDHGKTYLLDALRKTSIANNEAGGITQHIGAYTITKNNRQITFIDTPGHEAFTAMRARGAKVTDIAILVVAADDGVKPQTIEAIHHIKNAQVPMIVAINKIDSPQANVDRVKQQLTEHDVLPEEWGGDTIVVPISAKTGEGLDKLLDMMLLVADMENLRANPNRSAVALVIESKLDRGRGPVATLLVQNGTLKIGNTVVCGTCLGKIRAMLDQNGNNVVQALPSHAVEVLGFGDVPKAGDIAQVVEEKLAKQIVQERKAKEQIALANAGSSVSVDEVMDKMKDMTTLNIIVKADVQGSLEAIIQSIMAIKNEEVDIQCIHGGVGNVNETDILLAQTFHAMVVTFNVKTESKAQKLAEKEGVNIKNYRIIYDMLDDINEAVKSLVKPKYKEVHIGDAEVRMVYKITGAGLIAGCFVKSGSVKRGALAKIYRNDECIKETMIESLKVFKDDVKEVTEGFECGIKLREPEFKEGDRISVYVQEQIKE